MLTLQAQSSDRIQASRTRTESFADSTRPQRCAAVPGPSWNSSDTAGGLWPPRRYSTARKVSQSEVRTEKTGT